MGYVLNTHAAWLLCWLSGVRALVVVTDIYPVFINDTFTKDVLTLDIRPSSCLTLRCVEPIAFVSAVDGTEQTAWVEYMWPYDEFEMEVVGYVPSWTRQVEVNVAVSDNLDRRIVRDSPETTSLGTGVPVTKSDPREGAVENETASTDFDPNNPGKGADVLSQDARQDMLTQFNESQARRRLRARNLQADESTDTRRKMQTVHEDIATAANEKYGGITTFLQNADDFTATFTSDAHDMCDSFIQDVYDAEDVFTAAAVDVCQELGAADVSFCTQPGLEATIAASQADLANGELAKRDKARVRDVFGCVLGVFMKSGYCKGGLACLQRELQSMRYELGKQHVAYMSDQLLYMRNAIKHDTDALQKATEVIEGQSELLDILRDQTNITVQSFVSLDASLELQTNAYQNLSNATGFAAALMRNINANADIAFQNLSALQHDHLQAIGDSFAGPLLPAVQASVTALTELTQSARGGALELNRDGIQSASIWSNLLLELSNILRRDQTRDALTRGVHLALADFTERGFVPVLEYLGEQPRILNRSDPARFFALPPILYLRLLNTTLPTPFTLERYILHITCDAQLLAFDETPVVTLYDIPRLFSLDSDCDQDSDQQGTCRCVVDVSRQRSTNETWIRHFVGLVPDEDLVPGMTSLVSPDPAWTSETPDLIGGDGRLRTLSQIEDWLSALCAEGMPNVLRVQCELFNETCADWLAVQTGGPEASTTLDPVDQAGAFVLYDALLRQGKFIPMNLDPGLRPYCVGSMEESIAWRQPPAAGTSTVPLAFFNAVSLSIRSANQLIATLRDEMIGRLPSPLCFSTTFARFVGGDADQDAAVAETQATTATSSGDGGLKSQWIDTASFLLTSPDSQPVIRLSNRQRKVRVRIATGASAPSANSAEWRTGITAVFNSQVDLVSATPILIGYPSCLRLPCALKVNHLSPGGGIIDAARYEDLFEGDPSPPAYSPFNFGNSTDGKNGFVAHAYDLNPHDLPLSQRWRAREGTILHLMETVAPGTDLLPPILRNRTDAYDMWGVTIRQPAATLEKLSQLSGGVYRSNNGGVSPSAFVVPLDLSQQDFSGTEPSVRNFDVRCHGRKAEHHWCHWSEHFYLDVDAKRGTARFYYRDFALQSSVRKEAGFVAPGTTSAPPGCPTLVTIEQRESDLVLVHLTHQDLDFGLGPSATFGPDDYDVVILALPCAATGQVADGSPGVVATAGDPPVEAYRLPLNTMQPLRTYTYSFAGCLGQTVHIESRATGTPSITAAVCMQWTSVAPQFVAALPVLRSYERTSEQRDRVRARLQDIGVSISNALAGTPPVLETLARAGFAPELGPLVSPAAVAAFRAEIQLAINASADLAADMHGRRSAFDQDIEDLLARLTVETAGFDALNFTLLDAIFDGAVAQYAQILALDDEYQLLLLQSLDIRKQALSDFEEKVLFIFDGLTLETDWTGQTQFAEFMRCNDSLTDELRLTLTEAQIVERCCLARAVPPVVVDPCDGSGYVFDCGYLIGLHFFLLYGLPTGAVLGTVIGLSIWIYSSRTLKKSIKQQQKRNSRRGSRSSDPLLS